MPKYCGSHLSYRNCHERNPRLPVIRNCGSHLSYRNCHGKNMS